MLLGPCGLRVLSSAVRVPVRVRGPDCELELEHGPVFGPCGGAGGGGGVGGVVGNIGGVCMGDLLRLCGGGVLGTAEAGGAGG